MDGLHEVAGSIPAWYTISKSLILNALNRKPTRTAPPFELGRDRGARRGAARKREPIVFTVDVAEDLAGKFVPTMVKPEHTQPERGSFFVTEGRIFPAGTIQGDGANFDPNQSGHIGVWICRGTHLVAAHEIPAATLWVDTAQLYVLGRQGKEQLATEGVEGAGTVRRIVTGVTGNFAGWTGEQRQIFLGFNPTGGVSERSNRPRAGRGRERVRALSVRSAIGDRGPYGHAAGALLSGLGALHLPVATKNARAQAFFDQGLRLLYAFNHAEARRAFREYGVGCRHDRHDKRNDAGEHLRAIARAGAAGSERDVRRQPTAVSALIETLRL